MVINKKNESYNVDILVMSNGYFDQFSNFVIKV